MSKSKLFTFDNLSQQEFDEDAELIPLMTTEDEEQINSETLPDELPILPLRNTVLFPGVVIPITAGRDKSIQLINDANNSTKIIGVVSQKNKDVQDPSLKDLNQVGVVARILRVLKMPDGNTTVIIQGKKRFKTEALISEDPYIRCSVSEYTENKEQELTDEFNTVIEEIKTLALKNSF